MENELILWFWRGLLTLGMGGIVRLLIWQRKIEREILEQKGKTAAAVATSEEVKNAYASLSREVKEMLGKIATLVANMNGLPAIKNEVGACHRRLDDVAKTAAQQTGEMKQINNILRLIQEHLMGKTK